MVEQLTIDSIQLLLRTDRNLNHSQVTTGDLLEQLLATMQQLETMREAVIERYDALHEIIEIYAGMDGFKPQTAPEGYQQFIIKQMYEVAHNCLNEDASEYREDKEGI